MKKTAGFIKLPESELEVMQIIWDMEREGYKDIHAGEMFKFAPAIGRLKLTTVLTLITRLIGKGFLSVRKVGRVNCYTSLVDETAYKNFATKDFLETMYKNNASGLISALIGGDCLRESDIDALRRYIDESENAE
ncbi:MAG: BlaI/MecI/CopY family transcriptional regulator [Ruminococcaceae bacterium]|nr:BlaI/MecI/CopY family transcriptional regulator [Oscillospiraceae bacterium]